MKKAQAAIESGKALEIYLREFVEHPSFRGAESASGGEQQRKEGEDDGDEGKEAEDRTASDNQEQAVRPEVCIQGKQSDFWMKCRLSE